MIVGLQIFIEKEEMVLDSNFWCGYPENIQNQCFFLTKEGVSKFSPSFFMPKAPTFTSWGFVIT